MSNENLYRGYEKIIVAFRKAKKNNQLLHAYGFIGRHKSSKGALVKQLAKELLNTTEEGIHPDLLEYVCDNSSNSLETLRQFLVDFQGTPILADYRVAILYALDTLSTQGQNALLKTLEEPPKNHVVLCTYSSTSKVLPTIASRLIKIELPKIPFSDVVTLQKSNKKELLKKAYVGGVELFTHMAQEKVIELQEIHDAIQSLHGLQRWQTVENLFSSTKDFSQLRQTIATWIPLLRHELTHDADPKNRKNMLKIITGFSHAYHASNATTARLSIEKSLL